MLFNPFLNQFGSALIVILKNESRGHLPGNQESFMNETSCQENIYEDHQKIKNVTKPKISYVLIYSQV